jgi:hypothetical protein
MFPTNQIFVSNKAKNDFLAFFLKRINDYADAAQAADWTNEKAWTLQDVNGLLEEYSFKNIKTPFTQKQRLMVAGWIRKGPGLEFFARYSEKDLEAVMAEVQSDEDSSHVMDYLFGLVNAIQDWDGCPVGFAKITPYVVVDSLKNKLFENHPAVPDPSIRTEEEAEAVEEEEEDDTEEIEVEEKEVEKKPIPKEKSKEVSKPEKSTKKEEISKKAPAPPKKVFQIPGGPKLIAFVKTIFTDLEIENVSNEQRAEVVKFARSRDKKEEGAKWVDAVIKKAIKVAGEKEDAYEELNEMAVQVMANWSAGK